MFHPSLPRVFRRGLVLLCLAWGLPPDPLAGQHVAVGDLYEEYLRILQVVGQAEAGSFMVRPLGLPDGFALPAEGVWNDVPWTSRSDLGGGFWVANAEVGIRTFVNSAFPTGRNDGAVWQGKGLTTAMSGGGTLGWGRLTVTLKPQLVYTQNSEFELANPERTDDGAYRYPWSNAIDLPQRYGPDAFSTFDPGQSSVRIALGPITAGVGTENLWWGPGVTNAILMSNNAGGFPHGDLSTNGPVDIGIGRLEAQWVWGRLSHSDWWDETRTDRNRFITGAAWTFSPDFAEGLSVGASRVFTRLIPESGLDVGEYFVVLQGVEKKDFVTPEEPIGEDVHNQLFSVFARYVLPESGFEVWLEWARDDGAWDRRDLFVELEHSSASVVGLRKVTDIAHGRLLAVTAEVTRLEGDPTGQVRGSGNYYEHRQGDVPQGHTQLGQVLGAGLGPGGNAQFLGVDLYHARGRFGGFLQRRVHDNDAFYDQAEWGDWDKNHVSLDLGGHAVLFTNDMEVTLGATITRDFNRYFIARNDVWNANLQAAVRWRMR